MSLGGDGDDDDNDDNDGDDGNGHGDSLVMATMAVFRTPRLFSICTLLFAPRCLWLSWSFRVP